MKASTITLDQAKKDKLFYFVGTVVVFRESDKRCLLLKRDNREKVHPGKYGVIGGKLEWGDLDILSPKRVQGDVLDYPDAFEELLQREAMEEAGITIGSDLVYINSVGFIRPDGVPVISIKCAARYVSGKISLERGAFTHYTWVNESEVEKYECIEGIKDEVKKTIHLLTS